MEKDDDLKVLLENVNKLVFEERVACIMDIARVQGKSGSTDHPVMWHLACEACIEAIRGRQERQIKERADAVKKLGVDL